MSAAMPRPSDLDHRDTGTNGHDDTVVAGTPVVVRRNAGLAALVGAGASAIAIAYLWRATQSAAPLDWALCLVMAAVAGMYLAHLVDARTPLLVADDLGVRIRLGNQWRGLPWDAVDRVVVQPRRGLFRDGRLMFAPHSLPRALDGLEPRGRRAATLNQKMYGAALAVPMGLTTRRLRARPGARRRARGPGARAHRRGRRGAHPGPRARRPGDSGGGARARGRPTRRLWRPSRPPGCRPGDSGAGRRRPALAASAEPTSRVVEPASRVVEPVETTPSDTPTRPATSRHDADADPDRPARRSLLGGIGTIVSRVAKGRSHDLDADARRGPVRGRVGRGARGRAAGRSGGPVRRTPAGGPSGAARAGHPGHPGDRARQRGAAPRPVRRRRPSPHAAARGARAAPPGQRRPGVRGGPVRLGLRVRSRPPDLHARRPGRRAGHRRLRHRAGLRPGHRPRAGGLARPGRPERRRPGRADPDPPARHRVDRGRRLRAVRRRLLRPRPPAHAGAGAGQGPGAAAPAVRRPLRDRADQRPPGVRGRAGDRDDREHAQHGRRPQLGAAGRGRPRPGDDLGRRAAVRGRAARSCCRTRRRC